VKNQLISFDEVYKILRGHCLSKFPQHAECRPQLALNWHLKSSGSLLHAPAPGINFSHRTDDVITELDRYIINDNNREALFSDLSDMTRWMAESGYLRPDKDGDENYYPTDKLIRTPSIQF
jgi:hypothetical protein